MMKKNSSMVIVLPFGFEVLLKVTSELKKKRSKILDIEKSLLNFIADLYRTLRFKRFALFVTVLRDENHLRSQAKE